MKKKLAIVSSYNELCGNATYTYVLKKEFEKYYDVDVLGLNTFYLRSEVSNIKILADRHIEDLANCLKEYDYVNIQLEVGLFGIKRSDILTRFNKLVRASQNIIVTMHRLDLSKSFISVDFIKKCFLNPLSAIKQYRRESYYATLYEKIVMNLKKESKKKNVQIIVHTKRDKRNIELIFDFKNVHDHPITFLNNQEKEFYKDRSKQTIGKFRQKYHLESNDITIGIFGFISEYKGHHTAIKALKYLPKNYKLLIFGGQHPHSIMIDSDVDLYIKKLQKLIAGNKKRDSLTNRVLFCGSLDDEEFLTALHCVDFTVLPYMETGQSGSGIAALTLETKAKSFFSNNYAFFELAKYSGKVFETFDIGNYIELADKILYSSDDFNDGLDNYYKNYNIQTNIQLHIDLFQVGKIK